MKVRPVFNLALALTCAMAAGVCGTLYVKQQQARLAARLEDSTPVAVVEIAHCEQTVGALAIMRDGKILQLPSGAVAAQIESVLPDEHKGRAIVKGGCDTIT